MQFLLGIRYFVLVFLSSLVFYLQKYLNEFFYFLRFWLGCFLSCERLKPDSVLKKQRKIRGY